MILGWTLFGIGVFFAALVVALVVYLVRVKEPTTQDEAAGALVLLLVLGLLAGGFLLGAASHLDKCYHLEPAKEARP